MSFFSTLIASMTIKPAITAFVVATACTMLPAIPLASKRLCKGMPNEAARMFAAAVTNSTANWSSLSKLRLPISCSKDTSKEIKGSS